MPNDLNPFTPYSTKYLRVEMSKTEKFKKRKAKK